MKNQDLQKNQNFIESQQYLVQSDLDSTLAQYKLDQAESVITYGTHLFTVVGIFIAIAAFVLTGVSIRNFILGRTQRKKHEEKMNALKKEIKEDAISIFSNILETSDEINKEMTQKHNELLEEAIKATKEKFASLEEDLKKSISLENVNETDTGEQLEILRKNILPESIMQVIEKQKTFSKEIENTLKKAQDFGNITNSLKIIESRRAAMKEFLKKSNN